jgi:hypothetical protein
MSPVTRFVCLVSVAAVMAVIAAPAYVAAPAHASSSPIASFTWSPSNPVRRDQVIFTSTSTPSSGASIVSSDWEFGDHPFDPDTASGATVTKRIVTQGPFEVKLTVKDTSGQISVARETINFADLPQSELPAPSQSVTYQGGPGHDGFIDAPAPQLPLHRNWTRQFQGEVSYAVTDTNRIFVTTQHDSGDK